VEDEDSLRNLTSGILVSLGYTVLTASHGSKALETSQSHVGEIGLLLTDVVMPNMNGPALAELLTAQRPNLKVLYMSGYTGQRVGEGVLPDGSCFLAKPFSRENLAQKVREALEGTTKSLSKEAHA
jgi:DNA-binding NtrC family response regulator